MELKVRVWREAAKLQIHQLQARRGGPLSPTAALNPTHQPPQQFPQHLPHLRQQLLPLVSPRQ